MLAASGVRGGRSGGPKDLQRTARGRKAGPGEGVESRRLIDPPVYFRNTDFRFHFIGAFEMMSWEGAMVSFENSWRCDQGIGHTGGED